MAMETEQQALDRLKDAGYVVEFGLSDEGLTCGRCGRLIDPEDVTIDETVRFEGPSNPADEAVIFALSDTPCGHGGVLIAAFGSPMEEGADVIRRLGGDPLTDQLD
jgi:hypothetical protein